MAATMRLLSCAASSPGAEATCRASGMALAAGSGAARLASPQARSRAGGCLSGKRGVAAAAVSELGALHASAKEAALAQGCLGAAGCQQPLH